MFPIRVGILCLIVVLGAIGFCFIKDNHLFKPPVPSNQISYSLNGQFELNPLIQKLGLGTLSSPDSNTTTKKFAESLCMNLIPPMIGWLHLS